MSKQSPKPRSAIIRRLAIDLSIMTVIGIGLALIGPFGSFQQPLAYRLVSWLSFAYLGFIIYSPMSFVVGKFQDMLDLPALGLWVAAVLIATVPMTIAVWSIGFLPGPIAMPTLEQAMTSYAYVLIVGGGVTALFYALESRGESRSESRGETHGETSGEGAADYGSAQIEVVTEPEPEPKPKPKVSHAAFIDRLPAELGTNLIALEMEDHYVRAHTALGSELVLMRLRDAVAELDGLEGMQIHRSWWVARGSVEDVKREGRNIRLVLTGGLEAPVSRANVAPLKEEGWF